MNKVFTLVLILMMNFVLSAKTDINLQHVEPPNWWVGLKCNKLQLMIHGENISKADIHIEYEGVQVKEKITLENPNYVFLNLIINENAKAGKFPIIFTYRNKQVAKYHYSLNDREQGSAERQGFDTHDVIYLLMPDRFANGNPNNDDVEGMLEKSDRLNPDGRHGGDIAGIKRSIPYFKRMGYTQLWINPLLENNMPVTSYHGYAATDMYKIDPRYGTNHDYKELVAECKKEGIGVIIDLVFNHCGLNHWWMNDLPSEDWVHQFPEFTRTNYRASTYYDPYASEFDKNLMTDGWFDKTMPDMNQKNPYLANYLIQNSIWWIEYAGLSGVRMDTHPYPDKDMMADWAKRINFEYPNFSIVAEAWMNVSNLVAYWQKDAMNYDGYNSYVKSVFDFPMMIKLGDVFNQDDGWDKGMASLYGILADDYMFPDPPRIVVFADNHDGTRFATKIKGDLNKYKMAMAFILTSRGIPEVYYGTEIMMEGNEHDGHGFIREDFPGGWDGDARNAFTGNGLSEKQQEAQNYLRKLLNWRKNSEVIHKGKLTQFVPEDGIYVYFRMLENKTVMVVLNNNSDKTKTVEYNRYIECIKSYNSATEVISGKVFPDLTNIQIAPKSALILELK